MNPSFQWQVRFLRPNYHFESRGPADVRGSGSEREERGQWGEDGDMDSVQRGMDMLLGRTASEGR